MKNTVPLFYRRLAGVVFAILVLGFVSSDLSARIPEEAFVPRGEFSSGQIIGLDYGYSESYDLRLTAGITVGGNEYASATCSFAGMSASSWSYYGEANCGLTFLNIRRVNGSWVAEVVMEISQEPGCLWYDTIYHYEVPIPFGTAWGSATYGGYTQSMSGILEAH